MSERMDMIQNCQEKAARLMQETQMQELACELAEVGSFSIDTLSGQNVWSKEMFKIHGLEIGPVPSLAEMVSCMGPEAFSQMSEATRLAMEQGQPYSLQLEIRTPAGTRKRIRSIGRPVLANGRVIRVDGAVQDITAQFQVEEASRNASQIFMSFFELTPDLSLFWMNQAASWISAAGIPKSSMSSQSISSADRWRRFYHRRWQRISTRPLPAPFRPEKPPALSIISTCRVARCILNAASSQ